MAGDAQQGTRGQPDDGIAAPLLAALHRFEQVGIRPARELEIDAEGSVEVGEDLAHQGDAVETLGSVVIEFFFA